MAKDEPKLNCALCGAPTDERLRMNPYCPRCKKQVSDYRKGHGIGKAAKSN
jgi:ribosomal protein L33